MPASSSNPSLHDKHEHVGSGDRTKVDAQSRQDSDLRDRSRSPASRSAKPFQICEQRYASDNNHAERQDEETDRQSSNEHSRPDLSSSRVKNCNSKLGSRSRRGRHSSPNSRSGRDDSSRPRKKGGTLNGIKSAWKWNKAFGVIWVVAFCCFFLTLAFFIRIFRKVLGAMLRSSGRWSKPRLKYAFKEIWARIKDHYYRVLAEGFLKVAVSAKFMDAATAAGIMKAVIAKVEGVDEAVEHVEGIDAAVPVEPSDIPLPPSSPSQSTPPPSLSVIIPRTRPVRMELPHRRRKPSPASSSATSIAATISKASRFASAFASAFKSRSLPDLIATSIAAGLEASKTYDLEFCRAYVRQWADFFEQAKETRGKRRSARIGRRAQHEVLAEKWHDLMKINVMETVVREMTDKGILSDENKEKEEAEGETVLKNEEKEKDEKEKDEEEVVFSRRTEAGKEGEEVQTQTEEEVDEEETGGEEAIDDKD